MRSFVLLMSDRVKITHEISIALFVTKDKENRKEIARAQMTTLIEITASSRLKGIRRTETFKSSMSPTSGVTTTTAAADVVSLIAAETLTGIVVSVILRAVLVRIGRGALVSDIGVKTGPPVGGVSNDLRPTVRQLHSVLAAYGLAVARFLPAEVISGSLVLHRVAELVCLGLKRRLRKFLSFPLRSVDRAYGSRGLFYKCDNDTEISIG